MNTSSLPDNPDRDTIIADREAEIYRLAEQVRLLKALRFQAQSEKSRPHGHEVQYSLFNEAEMVADEAEEDDDKETQVGAHTRKKPGRRPISPDYPRVEVVHDIPEDEKVCGCGCELTRIGEDVS